jgi:hypothetical protein
MKTKDETLDMPKRWYAEVSDIRERYPLIMVVRDNSTVNSSKELNDFFNSVFFVARGFQMKAVRCSRDGTCT